MLINYHIPNGKPGKFLVGLQERITPSGISTGQTFRPDRVLVAPIRATTKHCKPIRIEFFATPLPPNPRNLAIPYLPFIL